MSPDVVAVANLLASLAAAFGLFFVAWQTREAARARELQATLAIFDDLGSDEMRELRRFVYNELPQDPADFTSETLKKVEKLTSAFGRAAVLCDWRLVNKKYVLTYYAEAFVLTWEKVRPYVEDTRKRRGREHLIYFAKLAEEASKYRKHPEKFYPVK